MASGKVLVVDDDTNLLELLKIRLESAGYEVWATDDEAEAKRLNNHESFDLAVIDLQLAQGNGIELMGELHQVSPLMPVIILTAYGSIESAVEAIKRGAYTYLTKPFDPRQILMEINKAQETRRLAAEVRALKGLLEEKYDFKKIIGKSKAIKQVLEQVSLIAGTDSTVYIHGESGTGKELIARAIHFASQRRDQPFVPINCAAIPETLLESELFGYEKGAFTGAVKSSKGLFTHAHGGTILLDEIGDMPLSIQAKLLRVLQERKFFPVGSQNPVEIDVRILVATNKDLKEEVRANKFREDLFFRIHVIPIHLPPLRSHKEDIPLLADFFLKKYSERMNKTISGLSPQAMKKLMKYDWPGNIRELENCIEFACAMTQQYLIHEDLILPDEEKEGEAAEPRKTAVKGSDPERIGNIKAARSRFEKNYLTDLLVTTQGNVSKAAQLAGLYRADLYNLMKKYEITADQFKPPKSEAT
jgi:two-component system response regulator GlrR